MTTMTQTSPASLSPPQSPQLAGGEGFTFEGAVAASYLVALLGEDYAPGMDNRIVSRVSVQQRNFGQPLDDVIVDFRDIEGNLATLSLQVKSSVIVSAAPSNKDFRAIIRDAWATFSKREFRKLVDRYGFAVEDIAKDKASDLQLICEVARASSTEHFEARFIDGGSASSSLGLLKRDLESLLSDAKGSHCSREELHGFLSHFVVIRFDFMHAGATDLSSMQTRVCDLLAPTSVEQAPMVWMSLHNIARDAAGKAGEFRRSDLVRQLAPIVRLRGSRSLLQDLNKITELAKTWRADIEGDVGGTQIDRSGLSLGVKTAFQIARFIQIKGLPGSGKSALLAREMDAAFLCGPVLFLKADRLHGAGWQGFAQAHGIIFSSLPDLLLELGAVGSAILFIDGIDRIEKKHKPIILDVLRAIDSTAGLEDWRIIASLRNTGIEPLRTWLGSIIDKFSTASVDVGLLEEDEAKSLATAIPQLRPLLFGLQQVRQIVRRPFFAKVLFQDVRNASGNTSVPQSELDLVLNWWDRAGYDTSGQAAISRRQAIIELSIRRAAALSQPIAIASLTPATQSVLQELLEDGIVQHARLHYTVRFAHDIFFEWSFFSCLTSSGEAWIERVKECGEPPAVARAVDLLAQSEFRDGDNWAGTLQVLSKAKMRSQWTRSWLLAPAAIPEFSTQSEQFKAAVMANDGLLLKKALVWFQAEKTVPNPRVLSRGPTDVKQVRLADLLGWPSDFATWGRFISFLVSVSHEAPVALFPDFLAIFEVWQNASAGFANDISESLLNLCAAWMRELDMVDDYDRLSPDSRFQNLEDVKGFRKALGNLIVLAATTYPPLTTEYLNRVATLEHSRQERVEDLLVFFPRIVTSHAQLFTDLMLSYLLEELPADRVADEEARQALDTERKFAIQAKPEKDRTSEENDYLSGMFTLFGTRSFSQSDWQSLSIAHDQGTFGPASPIREPFRSLFGTDPELAIDLLNRLCNHAITAWRQLHAYDWNGTKVPLPVIVEFPWGDQEFWGGVNEYRWFRGLQAPEIIGCGFMALEAWCLDQLEHGKPVDELIQKIVLGNQSVGVLGLASLLAMHSKHLSDTTFALVSTQFLWHADQRRLGQDVTMLSAQLMGFRDGDQDHVAAVKALSQRVNRTAQIRTYAVSFIFNSEFGTRMRTRVQGFIDHLPYKFQEQKQDTDVTANLMSHAVEYAKLIDMKTWAQTGPADENGLVPLVHVDPQANDPDRLAEVEKANRTIQENKLWVWVSAMFDGTEKSSPNKIAAAILVAKELDSDALLGNDAVPDESLSMRRGVVVGVASIVLRFREEQSGADLDWARGVLQRGANTFETFAHHWIPSMSIPWHVGISVARGCAAEILHHTADSETAEILLCLSAHSLNGVSLATLKILAGLWHIDARLTWTAFHLALGLCVIEVMAGKPVTLAEAEYNRRASVLNEAIDLYFGEETWVPLPKLPAPWISVPDSEGRRGDSPVGPTPGTILIPPPVRWDAEHAAEVLKCVPYTAVMSSGAKSHLQTFLQDSLSWTVTKKSPPGQNGRRDRLGNEQVYKWTRSIGAGFGSIAGLLEVDEIKSTFLDTIFYLEDEFCWEMLAPFCQNFVARNILRQQVISPYAIQLLNICQGRVLQSSVFNSGHYNRGKFYGSDLPSLLRTLMFVEADSYSGTIRFFDDKWDALRLVLPLIDNFIWAGGWSVAVMGHFLTLCERAIAVFPAGHFADLILFVLDGQVSLQAWHGTSICPRLADLVNKLANRETPMPVELRQKMLRILDALVDMGDRRSAALQQGEIFREIKI
jgi:hypothetical protein